MNDDSSGQVCKLIQCYEVCFDRECISLSSLLLSCGLINGKAWDAEGGELKVDMRRL